MSPPRPCRCREACPEADVVVGPLVDFSNPDSIRAFAADFLRQGRPLHNNAGALPGALEGACGLRLLGPRQNHQQRRWRQQLGACSHWQWLVASHGHCDPLIHVATAPLPCEGAWLHSASSNTPPYSLPSSPARSLLRRPAGAGVAMTSSRGYTKEGVAELCQVSRTCWHQLAALLFCR